MVSEEQSLSQQQNASHPPETKSHEQSLKFLFEGETLFVDASTAEEALV
jgi:hypothetical protein